MTQAADWLKAREDFFARHPEREYLLTAVPKEHLSELSRQLHVAGAATSGAGSGIASIRVLDGYAEVACIVRRYDPTEAEPCIKVFLLDGAPPTLPKSRDPRGEEQFCQTMWLLAEKAQSLGMSLNELMMSPTPLRTVAQTMPGYRQKKAKPRGPARR